MVSVISLTIAEIATSSLDASKTGERAIETYINLPPFFNLEVL
jgi:hypothetical protein